jgi:tetratricopeptide (TPR) repeat protein
MTRLILYNLILILLVSCSGKGNKEVYNPKAVELNNRGIGWMKRSNPDSAIILFDKAIAIDKTYYLPHSNKIGIYINRKEFDKALAESEMVVQLKPDLAEGWNFTGMLHDGLGDSLAAKKCYRKSIELFDQRISDSQNKEKLFANRLQRAFCLILIGKEKEGKEEMKKLQAEKPNDLITEQFLQMNKRDFINEIFKTE